jgi:hypothetical protein
MTATCPACGRLFHTTIDLTWCPLARVDTDRRESRPAPAPDTSRERPARAHRGAAEGGKESR